MCAFTTVQKISTNGSFDLKYSIISGSPVYDKSFLKENIDRSSFIIAADSGLLACRDAGISPDLVIGDFDSAEKPKGGDVIVLPHIKNDTDTLYCIKEAVQRSADEIDIFCALGGRTDHALSNILCLDYALSRGVKARILSEKAVISLHDSPFEIEKGGFKYFSLFALGGAVVGLTIKGAAYELNDYVLEPFSSLGQSNELSSPKAFISFKSGKLLLICSND